jgi:hypothetical protein
MSFVRRVEEAAAKKLKKLFLNAKNYADSTIEEVDRAEKELANAKIRAAEATDLAHKAAVDAAQKAQTVATELLLEVRAAEEAAKYQASLVDKKL